MTYAIKAATVASIFCISSFAASAAPLLAQATRTNAFSSTETAAVALPLFNNGSKTLQFETTGPNQTVVIIYNAECEVAAPRGTRLGLKILVDEAATLPDVGFDFAFCSAVDEDGSTWASAARQAVVKLPDAGPHSIKVVARLLGGPGEWRIDDSSLVVQRALPTAATRETVDHTAANTSAALKLKDDDSVLLSFDTGAPDDKIKLTYNGECVTRSASTERFLQAKIFVNDAMPRSGSLNVLCGAVDTTGKTWVGATVQRAVTLAETGSHTAKVFGSINTGAATGKVDDSSLVITRGWRAATHFVGGLGGNVLDEIQLPINPDASKDLTFVTTEPNQVVKLSFMANCRVAAAARGKWYGVKITVDGVEISPASGYDFALCSSLDAAATHHHAGFRQSVFTVPAAGTHTARVFGKMSSGPANWNIVNPSLIVE